MRAVLCSVVERISEEKQIEEISGDDAPVTCEKKRIYFQRRKAELKTLLASKQAALASHIVALLAARKAKQHRI